MVGFRMDDRAQSIGIARFFLALVVGAFVFWIVSTVASPLLTEARATSADGSEGAQATEWIATAIDYFPMAVLFIAFFGLIALSIFQREMLR